mmetsp:Transcript_47045/g.110858  ORF Transcript_47045/g.110858 Transcript_47045/m.110858 type:complete len:247 (+) Transcript_47045:712-1452(+)
MLRTYAGTARMPLITSAKNVVPVLRQLLCISVMQRQDQMQTEALMAQPTGPERGASVVAMAARMPLRVAASSRCCFHVSSGALPVHLRMAKIKESTARPAEKPPRKPPRSCGASTPWTALQKASMQSGVSWFEAMILVAYSEAMSLATAPPTPSTDPTPTADIAAVTNSLVLPCSRRCLCVTNAPMTATETAASALALIDNRICVFAPFVVSPANFWSLVMVTATVTRFFCKFMSSSGRRESVTFR